MCVCGWAKVMESDFSLSRLNEEKQTPAQFIVRFCSFCVCELLYILGKRAITKYIVVNWPCTVSYLIDYYGILSNILIYR